MARTLSTLFAKLDNSATAGRPWRDSNGVALTSSACLLYRGETPTLLVTVKDNAGAAADLTGLTFQLAAKNPRDLLGDLLWTANSGGAGENLPGGIISFQPNTNTNEMNAFLAQAGSQTTVLTRAIRVELIDKTGGAENHIVATGEWTAHRDTIQGDEGAPIYANLVHNTAATADPVATDDEDSGYGIGSIWINTTTGTVWRCISAADNAAVWTRLEIDVITVRLKATGNTAIATALEAGDSIDGVVLAENDLVWLADQSTATQDGIYEAVAAAAGAASRWAGMPVGMQVAGKLIVVLEGTNAGLYYISDTTSVVGTDGQTATQLATASGFVAKTLFDAYTMLFADVDNTPQALTIPAQSLPIRAAAGIVAATIGDGEWVGRPVTGNLGPVTAAQAKAMLGYLASEITNTPAGNIAATDVQAAINELDTEKAAVGAAPATHAATHERAGSDEIDGDHLDIDMTPANYTPTTTGVAEAAHVDDLAAHLKGIDNALATAGAVTSVHGRTGAVVSADGDYEDGQVTAAGSATNYTPTEASVEGHLAGIDAALGLISAGGVPVTSVADIDDPSTELNAITPGAAGELRLCRETETTEDQWTLYVSDNANSNAESVPYVVDGGGGYDWIAIGGKYNYFKQTVGQAEAEAGTSTTARTWTAERVRQAADARMTHLVYLFSTTTADADPGAGTLRFNNATPASVTEIYIDDSPSNVANLDLGTVFNEATGNRILILQKNDATKFLLGDVTADTDGTGYWKLTVTIDDSGSLPDNGASLAVIMIPGAPGSGGGGTTNIPFGASAGIPFVTTGAAPATQESATYDANEDVLLYDGASAEDVDFWGIWPSNYDGGDVTVTLYWDGATGASAADTVEWRCSIRSYTDNDAIDQSNNNFEDISDALHAVGDEHVCTTAALTPSGVNPLPGERFRLTVTRNVAGTDDMTEDAKLKAVNINYTAA